MFYMLILHLLISIHALTRSATCGGLALSFTALNFNPRTHKECDLPQLHSLLFPEKFQSTHSQGVRRNSIYTNIIASIISIHALTRSATLDLIGQDYKAYHFNPRTHKECDGNAIAKWAVSKISIHALTRSATSNVLQRLLTVCLFQSTHSQGVRLQVVS